MQQAWSQDGRAQENFDLLVPGSPHSRPDNIDGERERGEGGLKKATSTAVLLVCEFTVWD